jgi:hypothetical protein
VTFNCINNGDSTWELLIRHFCIGKVVVKASVKHFLDERCHKRSFIPIYLLWLERRRTLFNDSNESIDWFISNIIVLTESLFVNSNRAPLYALSIASRFKRFINSWQLRSINFLLYRNNPPRRSCYSRMYVYMVCPLKLGSPTSCDRNFSIPKSLGTKRYGGKKCDRDAKRIRTRLRRHNFLYESEPFRSSCFVRYLLPSFNLYLPESNNEKAGQRWNVAFDHRGVNLFTKLSPGIRKEYK